MIPQVKVSSDFADPDLKDAFFLPDDDENEDMIKDKPPRPPRKKVRETLKEALYEEDIIEGFSFVSFKTYEDLEVNKSLIEQ